MTADVAISAVLFVMLIRAIFSFLPVSEEGLLPSFLAAITEPLIFPIRLLCDKFDIGTSVPFDIPFLITYFILMFLSMAL